MNYAMYGAIGVICAAIVIVILYQMWLIWFNNVAFEQAIEEHMETADMGANEYEIRCAVHRFTYPRRHKLHRRLAKFVTSSEYYQLRVRSFCDYITYSPAWMILMVGMGGLILC